jgi:hypothetical protein
MPGKMTEITADDTDTTAFAIPFNKLLEVTRIQINNRVNEDVRVRGWDTFTDTDGTVHSSSASPVPVFDYPVASQDAIVVDCADKAKRVMGTLVLQAVSGSGSGIDEDHPVEVYVGGEFPF